MSDTGPDRWKKHKERMAFWHQVVTLVMFPLIVGGALWGMDLVADGFRTQGEKLNEIQESNARIETSVEEIERRIGELESWQREIQTELRENPDFRRTDAEKLQKDIDQRLDRLYQQLERLRNGL